MEYLEKSLKTAYGKGGLIMSAKKIRYSHSDRIFYVINHTFLLLSLLVVLFPLLNVIAQSFSSPNAVITGKVYIWPVDFSLDAYKRIFNNSDLLMGFGNTFFYTIFGTIINVTLTVMAGYPLSKKDFYGKGVIIGMFIFTMIFNGGLIPSYLLVKNLGLYNTRWAIIIPTAMSVWNVMIARTFFQNTIPDELCESAEIDGASDIRIIMSMILPLSKPIIAVLTLFYAVDHWNEYFNPMIYLQNKSLLPLQVVLRNILADAKMIEEMANIVNEQQTNSLALVEVLKYAIIVFASIPVLIMYPFVQKYFTQGIMIGSLKG